jgi:type VI secretion system secreted protein VgrG
MYDISKKRNSINLRFDGIYRGEVVDVEDPLFAARVRVKVHPMFSKIESPTAIPWAVVGDPSFGGIPNFGSIQVPPIGAHVWVFFENGDWRYPVYFAGAPAISDGVPDYPTLSREDDGTVEAINAATSKGVTTASGGSWDEPDSAYAAVYPNNRVFRSQKGILIEIDDTDDNVRFHVYHPSGTRTEVDNDGNTVEHVSAKKTTVIVGDNNIEVQGNQDTTTGGSWGVNVGSSGHIKTSGTMTIDAGGTTEINVTGACTVEASGNCDVKGSAVTVEASGVCTVKGSLVKLN